MSEEEGRPRPVASRRQVWRLTRHHLVPLAAMGIAAAESVAALCDRVMVSYVEVAKLRPKVEGQVMTSVWTESVRTWVGTLRNAPLRIHDPYSWVELIFHESVHLRMHRDRPWRPTTARAQYFQMQLPCPDLEQAIADRHAGNLELIAHPTSVGAPPVIRLHARSGSTELFEPIAIDPLAVANQLRRWRERSVPWLYAGDRLARAGSLTDLDITAPTEPAAMPDSDQEQEPTFRPYPRPGQQEGPAPRTE